MKTSISWRCELKTNKLYQIYKLKNIKQTGVIKTGDFEIRVLPVDKKNDFFNSVHGFYSLWNPVKPIF